MSDDPPPPDRVYHLALADEWDAAVADGSSYRRSTLGKSLDDVGFVHCSFAGQVQQIADLVYRGRRDVVLLTIDVTAVDAEIRVENLDGGPVAFPHIYGPVPLDAVVAADPVAASEDGTLVLGPSGPHGASERT